MTESQVRELFNEIADGEAGPSRVDPQLALRRGRARLRWRRACVACAPVLAAAAVAAVALAVGAGPVRPDAGPAAGAGPAAPRQFNPLIPNVTFGWLPPGESISQGGVLRTEVFMGAGPASALPDWVLYVYARGRCHLTGPASGLKCSAPPAAGSTTTRFSKRAPALDGHTAFWAGPSLVWRYARGGWAELTIPAPDFSALEHDKVTQGEAIKIAGHLRFGAATPPLVFPARFTGLTGQWRLDDVHYTAGAATLHADSYMLMTGISQSFPHVGDLGIWTNAPYVQIHPAPRTETCSPHDPATTNTGEIINGYRVVLKRMSAGGHPEQELCAAHADGLSVDITEFGPHPAISVTSLFRQLRLLGAHPANWTRKPLG